MHIALVKVEKSQKGHDVKISHWLSWYITNI